MIHGNVTNCGSVQLGKLDRHLDGRYFTQANHADLIIPIANTNAFGVLNVLGTVVLLNGFVLAVGGSFTF
jgi:hypothetical protein